MGRIERLSFILLLDYCLMVTSGQLLGINFLSRTQNLQYSITSTVVWNVGLNGDVIFRFLGWDKRLQF